jgi:hypothetical protein
MMGLFDEFRDWAAEEVSGPLANLMGAIDELQMKVKEDEIVSYEDLDQLQDIIVGMIGMMFGEDWAWDDVSGIISKEEE